MQKLRLQQSIKTKLSPQQVQFVKLLQVPTMELATRISEEIMDNPVLEEALDQEGGEGSAGELDPQETLATYEATVRGQQQASNLRKRINPVEEQPLLAPMLPHEALMDQLKLLDLNKKQKTLGHYLIGSLDADGYLRRNLVSIADELAATYYIATNVEELTYVLEQIQQFDPPGVGAKDLRECLLLQLARKPSTQPQALAKQVLTHHFQPFSQKNYAKLIAALDLTNDTALLKEALDLITQLTPYPINPEVVSTPRQSVTPDFVLTQGEGQLRVALYHDYLPKIRVQAHYTKLLNRYKDAQDAQGRAICQFVTQKIQRAQWFIEAIQQRKKTLLRTMEAIVALQAPFFLSQATEPLRPIFLRHVAERIGMDTSTISRAVSNKTIQTDFGTFSLKYFFSEPIATTDGKEVSSKTVKQLLVALIATEDKKDPYTDEVLLEQLKAQGYLLARRTVAKYRSQLKLPIARLRRQL